MEEIYFNSTNINDIWYLFFDIKQKINSNIINNEIENTQLIKFIDYFITNGNFYDYLNIATGKHKINEQMSYNYILFEKFLNKFINKPAIKNDTYDMILDILN